jgi:hypothetical protein
MNEKYTIVQNDLLEFDELFDVSQINMSYYFSNWVNNETKITEVIKKLRLEGIKVDMINLYQNPDKGNHREYCDVENRDDRIYYNFISQLLKQSHARNDLNYYEHLPSSDRKGYMDICYLFNRPKIEITYHTQTISTLFTFTETGLVIVYKINNNDSNKMMIEIKINENNEILSTIVHFNGKIYKEPEKIKLSHKQLDYLIALSHYGMTEEKDFNVEPYVDKVLAEDYKDVINYFKVKEMTYI